MSSSDYESDYDDDDDDVAGKEFEELIEFPETDSLKLIKDISRRQKRDDSFVPSCSSSDEESTVGIPSVIQLEPLAKQAESTTGHTKRICLPRSLRAQTNTSYFTQVLKARYGDNLDAAGSRLDKGLTGPLAPGKAGPVAFAA